MERLKLEPDQTRAIMENPSLNNDIGAPTVTSEQSSADQNAETESSDSSITSVSDNDSNLIHFLR